MLRYSVIWYTWDLKKEYEVFHEKDFRYKKSAINFYKRHKDDKDKFLWWVSSRDEHWMVVDDYII